jgi:hypothetical protein
VVGAPAVLTPAVQGEVQGGFKVILFTLNRLKALGQ